MIIDGNFYNPYSLFLICLDYVAKNVSMVESLAGFPEIVGEQLFHKVQESNGFHFCSKNLKLFCEAYGGLVLSQLSLTSEHIVTSNYLENLQLFVFLTELDVSHCHLGDSHDLLAFISHLQNLELLSLKDNCFSDTGVKKLTLPRRLLNDGLEKLSVLDLSLNPKISDDSIKYMVKMNSLTALNLSGTGITLTSGVPNLVDSTSLCLTPEVAIFNAENPFTINKGWAVNLVSDWKKASKELKENIKTNRNSAREQKGNFYKSTRPAVMKKATEPRQHATLSELPVILLAVDENKPHCSQANTKQPFIGDGRSDKKASERSVHPRKKLKLTEGYVCLNTSAICGDEGLDDELLRGYLNCGADSKPVKGHRSLLESLNSTS